MLEIAATQRFKIEEMECDKDHLHMLINYEPTQNISSIVKVLKQISTHLLYEKYSRELHCHFWKRNIFWSSSYFVNTVGVNEDIVRNYIVNQGK